MRDYWLSKFFYDVQTPTIGAEYRGDRAKVLSRYPLKPELKALIMADDVAALAPYVNPYLLRFYFSASGMPDAEFIRRLRSAAPAAAPAAVEASHG